VDDNWIWKLDPYKGYSVRDVYHLLATKISWDRSFLYDIVWIKVVPLKVSLFALRLLQNRYVYAIWCGKEENEDHLVVGYDLFRCI